MECQSTAIETEDAIRLLSDEERRTVVAALVDLPDNVVTVRELADRFDGGPSPEMSAPLHHRHLVSIKHNHLPRLDEAGLVEYDARSETVRYHPDERVERLVEFVRTELE